jgi:CRP-like cAMP-binding protein
VSTSSPCAPPPTPPALLAGLPPEEYERLLPALELVELDLKQVLYEPGERITHVYFPVDALVSLLNVLSDGAAVETGMAGRDGMVGLPLFLGVPTTDRRAVCQRAGSAWRLRADAFLALVRVGGELPSRLLRYAQAVLRAAAQTAACNRLHPVEDRCARWLLTAADHIGEDLFPMTQQFMAEMLGVRRASVVVVLGTLAQAGLIENGYGTVAITDRAGLEDAACECYRMLRADVPAVGDQPRAS